MANLLEKLSGFDPYTAWQKGKQDKLTEQILRQQIDAGDVSAEQTGQSNIAKSFFMDIMAAYTFADDEQASKKMVQQAINKVPENSSLWVSAMTLLGKTGGEYLGSLLKAVNFGGRQGFLPMEKSLSDIQAEGGLKAFKAKTDRMKAEKSATEEERLRRVSATEDRIALDKRKLNETYKIESEKKAAVSNDKLYNSLQDEYRASIGSNIGTMSFAEKLSQGLETGFGKELAMKAKRVAESAGIKTDGLDSAELVNALGARAMATLRNPDSGFGWPGAMSNEEMKWIRGSVEGLAQSTKGNIEILKLTNKMNKYKADAIDYANKLYQDNGGLPPLDFRQKMSEFSSNYKFFTNEERKRIKGILGEKPENDTTIGSDIDKKQAFINKYIGR